MTRVAIVGGKRTPFVKAGGVFQNQSLLDLSKHAVLETVRSTKVDPNAVDEVAFSSVLFDPRFPNLAREIVLRTELPNRTPGHFLSNNCISGLVAASFVSDSIRTGRIQCGIAGGAESMSRPTLTFHPKAEQFFLRLNKARSVGQKLSAAFGYRPSFALPQVPSPKEPSTGKTMGQHCELMAQEFHISRDAQDQWAYESHQKAAAAVESGVFDKEIAPLNGVTADNLVRKDTSLEKLSKLRPVFERSEKGTLTAGNSSALTDGASAVCLMSESLAKSQGLEILGFVSLFEFAAVDPNEGLLMAPGLAVPALLSRVGKGVGDIDLFEIHEAFSAQVLCNLQAWEKGWAAHPEVAPIGAIPREKINIHGGSIALGHPLPQQGEDCFFLLLTLFVTPVRKVP